MKNNIPGVKISEMPTVGIGKDKIPQVDHDLKVGGKLVCRVFAMYSKKKKIVEGHVHNGPVYFDVLKGTVKVILVDTRHPKKKMEYDLKTGQSLQHPAGVAHKAILNRNSILASYTLSPSIGTNITEKPYQI